MRFVAVVVEENVLGRDRYVDLVGLCIYGCFRRKARKPEPGRFANERRQQGRDGLRPCACALDDAGVDGNPELAAVPELSGRVVNADGKSASPSGKSRDGPPTLLPVDL